MKRTLLLWSIFLGGPLIWFITFGVGYGVAVSACGWNSKPALYTISVIALLLTAAFGVGAWSQWRRMGRELPSEAGGPVPASRTLASGGVILSALFCVIILAQIITQAILEPCQ